MARFVRVATTDEIPPGRGKVVEVGGREVAIFNAGAGRFYASGTVCPHEGGPLGEGTVEGESVICPWHGFDFDLRTGDCPVDPDLRIPTYEVKVEGNVIFVLAP